MGNLEKSHNDQIQYLWANAMTLDQLQQSSEIDVIIAKTFDIIKYDFDTYTSNDWEELTQVTLKNILYAVDEPELDTLPIPLSCDSYHQVLKGFNNAFGLMSENTKKAVFHKCIKHQLDSTVSQTGVRCGSGTDRTQTWLDNNLGSFAGYANITEFSTWNLNFQTTDVINTLSATQLSNVAAVDINNEEVACQIAGRVQQFGIDDVYSFLDTFYSSLQKLNIRTIKDATISLKYLSSSISVIATKLSTYSSSDWNDLLSVRLQPFLSNINNDQLSKLLGSADCIGYTIIIENVGNLLVDFSQDIQASLYQAIHDNVESRVTSSGVCPVSGEYSTTAVQRLFGKFSVFVSYADIQRYIPSFDGLSAIGVLSPDQIATLTFSGDILNNQDKAQILIQTLSGFSFTQLDSFLSSFQTTADQNNKISLPNLSIQSSLFNAIYAKVSTQFTIFTNAQWTDYWQGKFSLFLASITDTQIQQIPNNINCNAFQTIISALGSQYNALSGDIQQSIFNKAKSYLTAQRIATGSACPSITGDSGMWLKANLGAFSSYASIGDILAINSGFQVLSSVKSLTAQQLGSYIANNAILSDQNTITTVLDGINSQNIGAFLDTFNAACSQNGITGITNAQVKSLFLGEIFCKLSSAFSSFTVNDYISWFQGRLTFFVNSVNAKALGFLPVDISCDSLSAIVGGLTAAANPENPSDVYSFIKSVLNNQLSSTGSSCTGGGLGSRGWVLQYFGVYITYASWSDIVLLYPTIKVVSCVDIFYICVTTFSDVEMIENHWAIRKSAKQSVT
ncbi:uncharacterized protein LOC134944245 [Pseudophryne corroboree]|uniref:uncharacterized protein LOC134944245 n=1 Tax=Pseudophryne corroboree TaxID=495146 RepID=UPI00308161E3